MKILILANFGMGLYKFRKELIEKLVTNQNEVYVSCPNDDEYIPKLKHMGCQFIETSVDRRGVNPIKDLQLINKYKNIVDDIKPNIVLTYTIKPNIYGGIVCQLKDIPYITNITGLGTAVENDGILQKITLTLYRFALKKAKCVFFQNEENKEFFVSNEVIKGNFQLLPGSGVNLDEYPLIDYPKDDKEINFLFISRILKEKGIDQFLEAAEYIKERYPHTNFHILGFCENDMYQEKINKLQAKGIVIFHGIQTDVKKFLTISHCTIHPSYYPEGMSNVLLESASSGRPIITTDRSGCREIVDDGINGYIIREQNSKDLIEKISRFIKLSHSEKNIMGKSGREKVEKEFDRKIVVQSYLNEIRNTD